MSANSEAPNDMNVATSTENSSPSNVNPVSEGHGEAEPSIAGATSDAPESKNAYKRRIKAEKWESEKKQRRKDLKMRKKSRAEAQRQLSNWSKSEKGELAQNEPEPKEEPILRTEEELIEWRLERKEAKNETDRRYLENCANSFAVVIDCLWEEHHNERALKSLCQQIYYSYGLNKKSPNPAALYLTGVGPLLRKQLQKQGMDQWLGPTNYNEDYMDMVQFQQGAVESPATNISITGVGKEELNNSYRNALTVNKKQLVYLSSDAEETIDELDPNCAYVIGGIVDRNRLKGITHKKAMDQKLRTVKFPIRDHLALTSTHVLTVNHCVEMLLERQALGDWPSAVQKVIPIRKTKSDSQEGNDGKDQQSEEEEEDAEDDEEEDEDEDKDEDKRKKRKREEEEA